MTMIYNKNTMRDRRAGGEREARRGDDEKSNKHNQ
jgi:hypothetical protein